MKPIDEEIRLTIWNSVTLNVGDNIGDEVHREMWDRMWVGDNSSAIEDLRDRVQEVCFLVEGHLRNPR